MSIQYCTIDQAKAAGAVGTDPVITMAIETAPSS
jgi:hypothetical protein